MRIGLDVRDISLGARTLVYWQTRSLVELERDSGGCFEYTLYSSSARKSTAPLFASLTGPVTLSVHRIPNRVLHYSWLRAGWPPIETFTGKLALFHGMAQILPPQRSGKRVLTIYDVIPLKFPAWSRSSWLTTESLRRSARAADHITTISECSRRGICETLGVDEQKVTVIYPGVPPPCLRLVTDEWLGAVRRRYELDRPYILHVGELQPRKNLRRLFQAIGRLGGGIQDDLELVLVGPHGHGYEMARKDLDEVGPAMRVRFLGVVPDDDLRGLYQGARAFVSVSLHEGFGLPVLEAMACGAPVVVSDAGALPEVVEQAGLLVDPEDVESIAHGLERVVTDRSLADRLSALGKARSRLFTWDNAAKRVRSLYQELLG